MGGIAVFVGLQATQTRKTYGLTKIPRHEIKDISVEHRDYVVSQVRSNVANHLMSHHWPFSKHAFDLCRDDSNLKICAPRTPRELDESIQEMKDRGVELFFIYGGDGTNRRMITDLVRFYGTDKFPAIVPGKGGRENYLAKHVGINGKPEENLARLLAMYSDGLIHTTDMKTLKINTPDEQYGFTFGDGLVTNFFAEYQKANVPGYPTASWIILKTIASMMFRTQFAKDMFKKHKYDVELDGKKLEYEEYTGISVSALDINILWGAHPFPLADEGYHFIGGNMKKRWQLVNRLPKLWLKKPLNLDGMVDSCMQSEVKIESKHKQRMTIDGDTIDGGTKTIITPGPKISVVDNLYRPTIFEF